MNFEFSKVFKLFSGGESYIEIKQHGKVIAALIKRPRNTRVAGPKGWFLRAGKTVISGYEIELRQVEFGENAATAKKRADELLMAEVRIADKLAHRKPQAEFIGHDKDGMAVYRLSGGHAGM